MPAEYHPQNVTGLLLSGGIDSAVLLDQFVQQTIEVQPFYIQCGCIWQTAERNALQRFIAQLDTPLVRPLVELEMPVADLYGNHWCTTGEEVPDESTPDEAVFLWGRNPLLLVKAMLWCSQNDIPQLALATLANNPFADAKTQFLEPFQQALAAATQSTVEITRPFAHLDKQQVLDLGSHLPLHLTFSCLAPVEGEHCGRCNKCAERIKALSSLPAGDPTFYANEQAACPGISP